MIPEMTDPLGKHWGQPSDIRDATITDDFVTLTQQQVDGLAEYSTSFPSGVYPGKCWKRIHAGKLYLYWYGDDSNATCSVHSRKIKIEQKQHDLKCPNGAENWDYPCLAVHKQSRSMVVFVAPMQGYAATNRGPVKSKIGELGTGYAMDDFDMVARGTSPLKRYSLGNALRGNFEGEFWNEHEAWLVLSRRFALSYPSENGRFVIMQVFEENKYGFEQWQRCRQGDNAQGCHLTDETVYLLAKRGPDLL